MNDPKQTGITKLGSWVTYFCHVKGTKTRKKYFQMFLALYTILYKP